MQTIQCGPASASFEIDRGGVVQAAFAGVLLPSNAGALSALLLEAGVDASGAGLLCSVERSLVALPPIDPRHYSYVPPNLRGVPVAIIVTPEQAGVYAEIAEAAARSGILRRAFLSREQADEWLREQVQALSANRVWWHGRGPRR